MLNSLYIKNYRNLKALKIDSVAQVNLITGKNNTGKSTILEAIAIYASRGDLYCILQLLKERGEYFSQPEYSVGFSAPLLSSLFSGRIMDFSAGGSILIEGKIGNISHAAEPLPSKSVGLRFAKYVDELQKNEQGNNVVKGKYLSANECHAAEVGSKIKFEVTVDGHLAISVDLDFPRYVSKSFSAETKFQLIRTGSIDEEINGELFDSIALTPKEQYVVDALRIVEPHAERIAFVKVENSPARSAVVRLSNATEVLPLKSMGDGINRILTIILALVNVEGGFLLVDEFENGLHYSVQEKLWKIIFTLAKLLHVQVFVTTHSRDCISTFEKVANSSESSATGKLIRLDNVNGSIRQVEFRPDELKIAGEQEIEIR
ncbi:MAG: AAA family ATPase [Prevotellaceae bacterium]|jgi:ABC-type iron transport system FetAB ATPase subunit|nr:AAA family ATPase [Prevotellaceae bacterium]